jgi:hypothetical protein
MQPDGWDNAESLKSSSSEILEGLYALTGVKACASTETPRQ